LDHARTIAVLERLTRDIAERIRASCAHLSEGELLALASTMAILELKFLDRASPTLCERRRTSIPVLAEQIRLAALKKPA
jgi:hypothetical protein